MPLLYRESYVVTKSGAKRAKIEQFQKAALPCGSQRDLVKFYVGLRIGDFPPLAFRITKAHEIASCSDGKANTYSSA
jgi:hypothetical protein